MASVANLILPILLMWLAAFVFIVFGWSVYNPMNGLAILGGGLTLLGLVVVVAPFRWTQPNSPIGSAWLFGAAVLWLGVAVGALRLRRRWSVSDRERKPSGGVVWWSRRRLAVWVAVEQFIGAVLMVVVAIVR